MILAEEYLLLQQRLQHEKVELVAVSKLQPCSAISQLYDYGHRHFGENYVQELVEKQAQLPKDIQWHFIGHLQRNKVKYIAPFVSLIHTIDSYKLLEEVNKQAARSNRVIAVLLQMHIAQEETKHGMDEKELYDLLDFYTANREKLQHVRICGLMGMATFTDDEAQVKQEFEQLHNLFVHVKESWFLLQQEFQYCSMGMSGDYKWAIACGSNMVRIGSKIFGHRVQQ